MRRKYALVTALMVLIALLGCGGRGGGTASYTVGGTASGLEGTLVLQNNATDDLTLTADGAFTFAAGFSRGSSYSVTVSAQPVGQICTVNNGAGTIAGANVTDVEVVCTMDTRGEWNTMVWNQHNWQ